MKHATARDIVLQVYFIGLGFRLAAIRHVRMIMKRYVTTPEMIVPGG